MVTAQVTSKGQITIPVDVRKSLGLRPGSRVTFIPTPGGYEIRTQKASIRDLEGVVPPLEEPVTLEEMDEAIALAASAGE